MKFKIHGEINGVEDSLIIEGDSIKELREKAQQETIKRNWNHCWSEKIK